MDRNRAENYFRLKDTERRTAGSAKTGIENPSGRFKRVHRSKLERFDRIFKKIAQSIDEEPAEEDSVEGGSVPMFDRAVYSPEVKIGGMTLFFYIFGREGASYPPQITAYWEHDNDRIIEHIKRGFYETPPKPAAGKEVAKNRAKELDEMEISISEYFDSLNPNQ